MADDPKPSDPDWIAVHTKCAFNDTVVDRILSADGIEFVIHSDGTMSGTIDGGTFRGNWYWEGPYFCRTAEFKGENLGFDAEVIEVNESQMRYTRNRGLGEYSVVQIGAKFAT